MQNTDIVSYLECWKHKPALKLLFLNFDMNTNIYQVKL